jgi:predicted amidohydrolase
MLPEFFTTGVAYRVQVAQAAQPLGGWITEAMTDWAARHDVLVSGSMLVRDDGHIRNAQLFITGDGIIARHDKDLPTMWENALYVGGDDTGHVTLPMNAVPGETPLQVGGALCWELTRRDTVRRLAGHVDLVLAGSGWWSVPRWSPRPLFEHWERRNAQRAQNAPGVFARLVGAPVVHAAHVGELTCPLPGQPGTYRGQFEGGTGVWDSTGRLLAGLPPTSHRAGTARQLTVDVPLIRSTAPATPQRYWLTRPGPVPTYAWRWQRLWGRRFYASHVYQRPTA